ncbi:MAG: polysulfide reductase NrfD [Herpetosiphonaceae bacterium]|nr:polysulfide reductase NrfD [Herpetosiphonaceae bacterium]
MQGDRIQPIAPIEPVLKPGHTYASISDKISDIVVKRKTTLGWFLGFGIAFSLTMVLFASITYLFIKGVGIWGVDIPVAWGFAIINFVWWIGIGHAGTLISAFLLLMRQDWRTSINRFAEAMTLFAVACAGLFPILHLGRPWLFYWLIPYPNTMGLWPQFRSPLDWDFFAVSTYATVSLLFWYIGLIPDVASLRDRTEKRLPRLIFGIMALGWRGSAQHWHRFQMAYLLMAGLATPLVVSVHSIVSIDFAAAIIPGWHSTIFPPYFVIGAIFSGFAMVLTLAIPLRRFFGLQDFVTLRHINIMAKLLLLMGLGVSYGYLMELFMAWYSGDQFETYVSLNRLTGPYWPIFAGVIACNVLAPQLLWFPRVRTNTLALFGVALIVNVGMWLERFMIVVTSLHRDFLPSSWGMYRPTFWDWSTFLGTLGLFFTLFFLFVRVLPMIPMFEMRELLTHREGHTREEQQKLAVEPEGSVA